VNGIHRVATVVSNGGKEIRLTVHKSALIGPGNTLYFDPANSARTFVVSAEDPNDLIPVTPHFERRQHVRLGDQKYEIIVKEITTQIDLDAYEYLEGFHYKTSSAICLRGR
jgi:hypothetical protein